VGLGLEVARVRPLEACLQYASNPPIGIPEVIVDGRVLGLELDGALQLLDRLLHVAEPVIGPAEGVGRAAASQFAPRIGRPRSMMSGAGIVSAALRTREIEPAIPGIAEAKTAAWAR